MAQVSRGDLVVLVVRCLAGCPVVWTQQVHLPRHPIRAMTEQVVCLRLAHRMRSMFPLSASLSSLTRALCRKFQYLVVRELGPAFKHLFVSGNCIGILERTLPTANDPSATSTIW